MTIKVSAESGGPYAHEIDAIRDERYRAKVMKTEPDFATLFADVEISPGAAKVIEDIDKPIELPVGEFVENVVYDAEETPAESEVEEGETQINPNYAESPAQEVAPAEPGNAESDADTPLEELEEIIDSPIFDEVSNESA